MIGRGATLGACLLIALVVACDDGYLRGAVEASPDGRTYLAIHDDNGGGCGPIKVDGEVWPFPMRTPRAIEPGRHTIECGIAIEFDIPKGKLFKFDYWGP
ncbi:conserved exported hypothetical protein [Magnetospirillum sp. UT-4]|nr:conserved exported hypothetical protein [Magnetospirillum sp. UT-4]